MHCLETGESTRTLPGSNRIMMDPTPEFTINPGQMRHIPKAKMAIQVIRRAVQRTGPRIQGKPGRPMITEPLNVWTWVGFDDGEGPNRASAM